MNSQTENNHELSDDALESIKDIGTSLFAAAALIMTINLGLVTTPGDPNVLKPVKNQIFGSTLFLLFSLVFGLVNLSQIIEIQRDEIERTRLCVTSETIAERTSNLQAVTFVIGLGLLTWAVFELLGI